MTAQELNEAVARKLGWFKHPDGQWNKSHELGGEVAMFGGLPTYSTSIEAAWELTRATEHPFSIQFRSDMHDPLRQYWDCWFGGMGQYRAEADTAPMAICQAFLKLPAGAGKP